MALNKEKIRDSFSKSAASYDRHADLQRQMAEKLFSGLKGSYKRILDIGSGTGELVEKLARKYPEAKIIGLDLASGMIEAARNKVKYDNVKFIEGDGEELPFAAGTFDLVVSSASLQWMDAGKVFKEVVRVLGPAGEFHFTTFGPATLCELKRVGLAVNDFPSRLKLEKVLREYFKGVGFKKEIVYKNYDGLPDLFLYLKMIGARYPVNSCNKGLLTKSKIFSLFSPREKLAITFEVYYGIAYLD